LAGAIINHHTGSIHIGYFVDGLDAGLILVSGIEAPGRTVGLVPGTGHSKADCLAGHILGQEPGREQEREINNGEQQHQQDGQRQCKLDHPL
jgi:hypothetical protein